MIKQLKKEVEKSQSNENEMKIITEKLNSVEINASLNDGKNNDPIKLYVSFSLFRKSEKNLKIYMEKSCFQRYVKY